MKKGQIMFLFMFIIIGFGFFIFEHETTHAEIYRYVGNCENIRFGFNGISVYTEAIGCDNIEQIKNLNAMTEIEGYHSKAILFNLWLMFILIYMAVVRK